jgi:hypothetical protein
LNGFPYGIVVHIITIGGSGVTITECHASKLFCSETSSGLKGWREQVSDGRLEEIRIAQAVDLIGPELIWLATERNLDNPDGQLGDETGGD